MGCPQRELVKELQSHHASCRLCGENEVDFIALISVLGLDSASITTEGDKHPSVSLLSIPGFHPNRSQWLGEVRLNTKPSCLLPLATSSDVKSWNRTRHVVGAGLSCGYIIWTPSRLVHVNHVPQWRRKYLEDLLHKYFILAVLKSFLTFDFICIGINHPENLIFKIVFLHFFPMRYKKKRAGGIPDTLT